MLPYLLIEYSRLQLSSEKDPSTTRRSKAWFDLQNQSSHTFVNKESDILIIKKHIKLSFNLVSLLLERYEYCPLFYPIVNFLPSFGEP